MQIRDIMTQPVRTVRSTASVQDAAELMALHDVGALPVCEDGLLIGVVTDRDIILRAIAPGLSLTNTGVHRIMTPDPVTAHPSDDVAEAARTFTNLRIRRLPIVEEGRPVGMLSVDDVARHWDNDVAILVMVRRVAPRRRRLVPATSGPLASGEVGR